MSEIKPLTAIYIYRAQLVVCIIPRDDDELPRFVVVSSAARRQAISLYECESIDEALTLIDAICAAGQIFSLPAGVAGGARAESRVAGSMQTV